MDPVSGTITDLHTLTHLDDTKFETARLLRDTLEHYKSGSSSSNDKDILERIVREQSFTILNRFCALRMAEARGVLFESIAHGYNSKGFQLYSRLAGTSLGETGEAYRCYLFSIFDEFAVDLAVLFDRYSPMGRLFPREAKLLELLEKINHPEITPLWAEDETIGWIYQYFNSVEERREMRTAGAPRNSRELAVRNQFFTPRYVVEFLTDNTLGRTWYEMTQGHTGLKDQCQYLVRRPNEIFLGESEDAPASKISSDDINQEELLKKPVYIQYRSLKDPREIRMLDPACGSMHFGLYAFDLFQKIYEEAWTLEEKNGLNSFQRSAEFESLHETYIDKEDLRKNIPRLIIEYNIHGIDIDSRAVQIAGLSLWLRAQRAWKEQDLKPEKRPRILRSNIVCAEPMPGEVAMLQEFAGTRLKHPIYCHILEEIFEKMKMAGEAGSLLKIEDEITAIIEKARQEWKSLPKTEQTQLLPEFDLSQNGAEKQKYVGIKSEKFWDKAEDRILRALEEYAEHTEIRTASQKRLFAEDAAKGFAFIDLCRKRFDVIMMNPPFGNLVNTTIHRNYLKQNYPDNWTEYYNSFIARALSLKISEGKIGAIIPDRFLFAKKSSTLRKLLTTISPLDSLVDCGRGVMDDAAVDAILIIIPNSNQKNQFCPTLNVREVQYFNRPNIIQKWINNLSGFINLYAFSKLPGNALAYDAPKEYLKMWVNGPHLQPKFGTIATGGKTFDDFRFLRLRWEVQEISLINDWKSVDTGGDYQPWISPSRFIQNWKNHGKENREFAIDRHGTDAQVIQSSKYWFTSGLSYPLTSSIGFGPRVFPSDTILSADSIGIVPKDDEKSSTILALVCSSWISQLLGIFGEHRRTENSIVKQLPIIFPNDSTKLEQLAKKAIKIVTEHEKTIETSPFFSYYLDETDYDFSEQLINLYTVLDTNVANEYHLIGNLEAKNDNKIKIKSFISSNDKFIKTKNFLSISFGILFGRWNIWNVLSEKNELKKIDPFAPLPVCPPAMLQNSNGLPVGQLDLPTDYPVQISWSGILVDDEGHPTDIIARIRDLIEVIRNDKAGDLEQEACEILNVDSLRQYFKKPSGFFADHLKRYSKSRRQAPIYWPLSTRSGDYTIWLYYPRLTDQTLYICINDFVEPKLKQTANVANNLRNKAERSRKEENELEQLTDLEQELKEFHEELLRIAQFWKPNLNDGVVITASPLWKLFKLPKWQETLKETWEKLENEEYDWAHLAFNIWPDRIREKCKTDKSLAIAHNLEELFIEPSEPSKGSRKGRKKRTEQFEDME
jgi:hypothetical protein